MSRYQSSFKYRRNAKLSKLLEPAIAQDEPNDSLPRVSSATTRLPDTQPDAEEPFISPYIGLRRIPLLRKGCEICGDFGTVPWHCNLTEIAELRRSADAGCQSCDILRQGYDKCRERNDADRISVDVGREFFLKMQIYNDGIVMYLAFHVKRGEPALEGKFWFAGVDM
jgi:hypothetical protein